VEFRGARQNAAVAFGLHIVWAMQRSLLLVAVLVGVSALVGCAGNEPPPLDPSSDPAFIPPGQGDLEIGKDPEVKEKRAPRARKLLEPNKAERKLQANAR
jgi:hypothetical protein